MDIAAVQIIFGFLSLLIGAGIVGLLFHVAMELGRITEALVGIKETIVSHDDRSRNLERKENPCPG